MNANERTVSGKGSAVPETSSPAGPLRISTLGPLTATVGSAPIRLGGPQQRAVLAVLVVRRPALVPLDRIADDIWAERVPAGYVRTIHTYVHHLREVLAPFASSGRPSDGVLDKPGHSVITTVGGSYQLTVDEHAVDALVFQRHAAAGEEALRSLRWAEALEHFDSALSLWRGDVLADLAHLPFVAEYAGRLSTVRTAALAGRIDALLAMGEHAAVVPDLNALTSENALDERFHEQRVLALYRCGRQGEALAAYRTAHQVLDAELGVPPDRACEASMPAYWHRTRTWTGRRRLWPAPGCPQRRPRRRSPGPSPRRRSGGESAPGPGGRRSRLLPR